MSPEFFQSAAASLDLRPGLRRDERKLLRFHKSNWVRT